MFISALGPKERELLISVKSLSRRETFIAFLRKLSYSTSCKAIKIESIKKT